MPHFGQWILQTALLVLAVLASWTHGYCMHGGTWMEHDGSCYYWAKDNVNWFKAELSCRQFGGGLVSIGNPTENEFMRKLTYCSINYWIGLVNTVPSQRGNPKAGYEWWDGSPHNFTTPLSVTSAEYKDCVFSNSSGIWNNNFCSQGYNYICKVPAVQRRSSGKEKEIANPAWWWHTETDYTTFSPRTDSTSDTTTRYDFTDFTTGTDYGTPTSNDPYKTTESAMTLQPSTAMRSSVSEEESTVRDMTTHWRPSTARRTTLDATTEGKATRGPTTLWPSTARPTNLPPIKCPHGWQQLDNNCYLLSDNSTNYFNAQMSYEALGATVTSVLTPRENTLLYVYLGCNSPTWIGLEKAKPCFRQPNRDHCWVWMDRSPVNYFEWAPGQPQNTLESECVTLDGQWKVTHCFDRHRYLCKKPIYATE